MSQDKAAFTLCRESQQTAAESRHLRAAVIGLQPAAGKLGKNPLRGLMPETRFCYCCRCHHPVEQMRPFRTRTGLRWRCLRSIAAAATPMALRDDFGRQQSARNREERQGLNDRRFVPLAERQLAR